MRVLPGVVGARQRRRLTVAGTAVTAAVAVAALAGCSQFDAALGQRQAVRSTCAKVPAVKAQPLPSDLNSPYALQQVTFRIDHATDADVARLETCLGKFPAVVGITLQDSSDMGG